MTTPSLALDPRPAPGLLADLLAREPTLARFGFAMWLLAIPVAVAIGVDERTLREANVWAKPFKFLVSVGLLSLTTAWFVGLLPAARRRARPVRIAVALIVGCGSFEIGYIVLQAALGQASHYNVGDPLHGALYTLMGIAAVAMTASQPILAREIALHAPLPRGAWRSSVLAGLVLTFVLGTAAGLALGGRQPPSGGGLALLGWHASGDLRPAHFVGMHAHHVLPALGWLLDRARVPGAGRWLGVATAAWIALWIAAMAAGLRPA
jgi:hypothetical protein